VCVVFVDLHCQANKENASAKKCGNCGGNHKANYRRCPIYKELKTRLQKRMDTARVHQGTVRKLTSIGPWPIPTTNNIVTYLGGPNRPLQLFQTKQYCTLVIFHNVSQLRRGAPLSRSCKHPKA